MNLSHYYMPVHLYMGDGCVEANKEQLNKGKRALIVTYEMPEGVHHYALEDVQAALTSLGIDYCVSTEVKEDPPISSIDAIRKKGEAFGADFVIGIGGGSALDTAKAVAVSMNSELDTLSVIFNKEQLPHCPVLTIPTTCGTGAELTCWIAVSRDDIAFKGPSTQRVYPYAAFIDARYISELPPFQTRSTLLDALCHASESYINIRSNPFYRAVGEEAMKLFGKCKDSLLTNEYTKEDRENMILCAALAGIAMTECGSSLPHGCSYPISLAKHMPHGLACACTLYPYFSIFKDQTVINRILEWCQWKDLADMEQWMKKVIGPDMARYEATDEEIEAWSDEMAAQTGRFAVHPEPAGRPEIVTMYKWAFNK